MSYVSIIGNLRNLIATAMDVEFDEKKHPRRADGQFAPKNSGRGAPAQGHPHRNAHQSRSAHLKPAPADRASWPEHIRALRLPPAWRDVRISSDPGSDLQAIGIDAKGRPQYVYSERFVKTQSAIKFARIAELDDKFEAIRDQNDKARRSRDPKIKDHADCTALVMEMGLRPGGDDDTRAEKRAYGASTLEGRHVVVKGGKVRLQFVGKKGVDIDLEVTDPDMARMLRERARAAGPDGPLFPHVSAASLLNYVHGLDGGGWKTKDMRTLKATRLAHAMVHGSEAPKSDKEYKKRVREVAVYVSSHLGNTPAVALASYISPEVFAPWRSYSDAKAETASEEKKPNHRLPEVRYGRREAKDIDWRHAPLRADKDDDAFRKPPPEWYRLLGFNPFVRK
jgi:DNA topoisomerase-1